MRRRGRCAHCLVSWESCIEGIENDDYFECCSSCGHYELDEDDNEIQEEEDQDQASVPDASSLDDPQGQEEKDQSPGETGLPQGGTP